MAELILKENILSNERICVEITAGQSLSDIIESQGLDRENANMMINDVPIDRHWFDYVRVKENATVYMTVVPTGDDKNPLQAILLIASIFVPWTLAFSGVTLGAGAIGGFAFTGLGVLAKGAIFLLGNSLSSPPNKDIGTNPKPDNPAYTITGSQNKSNPYGVVPRVYGRHRVYPTYAASPYTKLEGQDHYLYLLFDFGYGPLDISDFQIGDTDLTDFNDWQMELRAGYPSDPPITLFTNKDVEQKTYNLECIFNEQRIVTTGENADKAVLNFTLPEGLAQINESNGDKLDASVSASIAYREHDTAGPWLISGVQFGNTTEYTGNILIETGGHFKVWQTTNNCTSDIEVSVTYDGPTIGTGTNDYIEIRCKYRKQGETSFVSAENQQKILSSLEFGIINVFNFIIPKPIGAVGKMEIKIAAWEFTSDECGPYGCDAANDYTKLPAAGINSNLGTTYSLYTLSFLKITAKQTTPYYVEGRIFFPSEGKWDIQIIRGTQNNPNGVFLDKLFISSVRSIDRTSSNLNLETKHCLLALRIRANDQLNGVIDSFNAIAHSRLNLFIEGVLQTDTTPTSNNAAIALDILRGDANANPIPDVDIDFDSFLAWQNYCFSHKLAFNAVYDFGTTVHRALQDVASTGRASIGIVDGKHSVIIDEDKSIGQFAVPIQMFTPRNSWGYKGTKIFPDIPHAFRCRFKNHFNNWEADEVVVYDDGYNESNATIFEALEFFGCTGHTKTWRLARFYLAALRLRPETHQFQADVENIICNRGDWIEFAHDVPQFGSYWGLIKSFVAGTNVVTKITLDSDVFIESPNTYVARMRLIDGTFIEVVVSNAGASTGYTKDIHFVDEADKGFLASDVDVGNLILFGLIERVKVDMVVTRITHGDDLSATLECVDLAPEIHNADKGDIPDHDSKITTLTTSGYRTPAKPIIDSVISDESVLELTPDGGYAEQVVMTVRAGEGGSIPTVSIKYGYIDNNGLSIESGKEIFSGTGIYYIKGPAIVSGTTITVWARALGTQDVEISSKAQVEHLIIGASTKPHPIIKAYRNGDFITWEYQSPPRDFAGYQVRDYQGETSLWGKGVNAHSELIKKPIFDISRFTGLRTFMIHPVDLAGNTPIEPPASIIIGFGDPPEENIVFTNDQHSAGFIDGTITNGTVSTDLQADIDSTPLFWKDDNDEFWNVDITSLFWPLTSYKEMVYQWRHFPDQDYLDANIYLEHTILGGYKIEYREVLDKIFWGIDGSLFWGSDDDLFWESELAGEWALFTGIIKANLQSDTEYEFRITCSAGTTRGVISKLKVITDVPDIEEHLNDVAISAGGTRLPIKNVYRLIKNVGLTLQSDGGSARTTEVIDKNATLGPLVKTFDSTHTSVAGTIDATPIQGY